MKKKLLIISFFLLGLFHTQAQINLSTNGMAVTENFNAMGTSATANLPTAWKMGTAGNSSITYNDNSNLTAVNQQASSGSPTAGGRYNWGTSTTDRAIGFMTSGSYANPNSILVAYKNNNVGNLKSLVVSFNIKRYRINTRPASVSFFYSTDGSTWNSVSAGDVAETDLPTGANTYTFSSPTTVTKSASISNLTLAQNALIYLRWELNTGSSNSQGIGLDDVSVTPTFASTTDPALTVSPTAVAFGTQNILIASAQKTITLTYGNLTNADVTVSTEAPFSISKTANGTYDTNITYNTSELTGTSKDVFIKFTPTVAGNISKNVTITGGGLNPGASATLSGIGIDPNITSFSFENCTPVNSTTLSDGFTQYSVTGAQTWACTTYGHDASDATGKASAGNAVQINGGSTSTSTENEDWLISPVLSLSTMDHPLLSFWSRTAYNGPSLQLKVSTNYSGTGNPQNATWVNLDGRFPAVLSDTWTKSQNIDLTSYKSGNVYIAFVYTSTASNPSNGARWTIDDVEITNSSTPAPTELNLTASELSFGFQAANSTSTERTFTFSASNISDNVSLSAPANFTISKTSGGNYLSNLNYSVNEANNVATTVYAKFTPTAINTNYSQNLTISTNGVASKTLGLSGNSFDTNGTLEVVNWNIEWFGSTASGQGPTDKTQQAANVKSIFNSLNADIYGLAEIVDTTRFRNNTLPAGYNVIFSDFGSYADDKNSSGYAGAQKLAFMYRTDIIKPVRWFGVLRDTYYPGNTANNGTGTPYKNWSSGRFPFLMEAKVKINNVEETIYFIEIHAKANTGSSDAEKNDAYDRRKGGSLQLKQWIDANLAGKKVIVLGDFNDVLNPDKTIAPKPAGTGTSYSDFTLDQANYFPVTLPLSLAGKRSTAGFNTVIDNVIINKNLNDIYLNNSAEVLDNVAQLVSSYSSTTTDHYPVQTRYFFQTGTLPVKFDAFTAKEENGSVAIRWSTVSEKDNHYFTVERSHDGLTFEKVKDVAAKGDSNQKTNYGIIDNQAKQGLNYYRLKQTDINGTPTYFPEVRSVNLLSAKTGLLIYPNPVRNQIGINYTSSSSDIKLNLLGSDGRTILKLKGNVKSLADQLNSKITALPIGVYIIQLTEKGVSYQEKLIKQ